MGRKKGWDKSGTDKIKQLIFSSNFIPLDIIHTSKNHPIYISNL